MDGLDEDQSRVPGGNSASIASLLPIKLPPNVRVLVTSRPSPGLPPDVGGGHPLRHCRVAEVTTTAAARHTEYEARFDLEQALSGDQLQRDLVGLLTAARGTLTVEDLRELTGEPAYELRRRLSSAFGRVLRLRGGDSGGDVMLYGTGRGYLFAHETLLAAAQDELGPDAEVYLERLHSWAETYQRRGWPESTPVYLLQQYGRLLALLPDTRRTVALATDAGRRDRLREATGSDAAWLAEVATARQTVRRGAPADLGDLAALSAVADLMTRRDEPHPDIPATYARLGHIGHAVGLARSVFHPIARSAAHIARLLAMAGAARQLEKLLAGQPRHGAVAAALVALAGHCAADDPDRAMGLLAEVERDQQYATDTSAAFDRHERLASLAGALVAVGRPDEAERLVEALGTPGARGWGYAVASAAADEDPRRALRLATQAAAETVEIDPRPRANMLVPVVRVLARIGAVNQAVKLGEQLVGQLQGDPSCAAYFCSVRAEIAAGLWQHAPATAGRLVDMELESGRPLGMELAQFLVAVGPHDDQRGARIKELLSADFKKRSWSDERALLGLLTAAADPAEARSRVDRAAFEHDKFQDHRTDTVLALAYASLGDHEAARAVAWRQETEEERSETLAALAEYVACLPADLRLTQIRKTPWADILTVRRLAGLLAPPSSGPDIPRARSLLAEALTPDGWHYAAPVLAAIDPDAVLRVRAVVFGHLGLTLSD